LFPPCFGYLILTSFDDAADSRGCHRTFRLSSDELNVGLGSGAHCTALMPNVQS
jgi:hypothetical protein